MCNRLFAVVLASVWIAIGMVASGAWTITAPDANETFDDTSTIVAAGGKETNYMVAAYLQREVSAGNWVTQDSELDSDVMDTVWGVEFEPNPEWEVQGADRIRMCSVDAVEQIVRVDRTIIIQ